MREGWEVKKLGEVCEKITDGTHQTPKYFNEGFIFLSSKNVTSGKIDWENIKYIDEKQHLELHKRVAPKLNDILLAKNGTTGVAAMVDRNVAFDIYVSLALLRPLKCLSPHYLLQFINSPFAKEQFNKRLKGIGVPNLHLQEIREVEISIPPILEQKRIVEILDEAFAAIDKAKANVEKNLQNARELFESYLQDVFDNKGEDWEEKRLKEICEDITDGDHLPPPKSTSGVPFITISNINKQTRVIDFKTTFSVSNEYFKKIKPNRKPTQGDVLYTVTGSFGIPVLIDYQMDFCFQRHIGLIRPGSKLSSNFLYYWILSPQTFKQADNAATGTAQRTVSLKALRNFIIPIPSLVTQTSIVRKLDKISFETKKLETVYLQKLHDLEELKKSILQKAFSGELTNELSVEEELQLLFMSLNIFMHDGKKQLATLAEVKMEKMCHFAESRIPELRFNRAPVKEEYGPADFKRLYRLHNFAEANDIFTYERGADYEKYPKGENFMKWVKKALQQLAPIVKKQVTALVDLLKPLKTRQIDVLATTYAAWNNLLIRGVEDSFDNIRTEALWHARKFEFTDDDFRGAIDFLKANHLVPEGKGKLVLDKTA